MKVAINVSSLYPNNQNRGIGVYVNQLFKSLRMLELEDQFVLARDRRDLREADLVHFPNFDLFFLTLPFLKNKPWVITVHDVIPLVFPGKFPAGVRGQIKFLFQKQALGKADAIITDSFNSKQDIMKYLKVCENRVKVIHLAASKRYKLIKSVKLLEDIKERYQLNRSFILYVGDVNYNKNIPNLVRSFSKIKSKVDLVLVGRVWKNTDTEEVVFINRLIKRLRISDRVKQISSLSVDSHVDLVGIYNLAKVYVQPSLYEGFGLPVLEAMACGTLVVSSDVSSLPEVCGDASILVKPTVEGLRMGIEKALRLNAAKRENLIRSGLAWVRNFTWEKTARQTVEVYNSVLANSRI